MPKVVTTIRARAVSWWLSGEEECPHCGQIYAYELEFRCPECDSPSCPHCRQILADEHLCPQCVDTGEHHHG